MDDIRNSTCYKKTPTACIITHLYYHHPLQPSVDFATDEAIQKTIQTEFVNCTILCIAHRLLTVIEYDRILVLDHGQIAEFGSPYTLISDPTSQFHAMCRKSGEFEALMAAAKRGAKDEAVLA